MKDLASRPQTDVNQMIEGQSSGVDVLNSNQPGATSAVRIRGFSTIRNNDPLYVIDGVPTTSSINLLNPNDIESFQILKDASSASIYGSRAANGVIVITTKKGKKDKVSVNLDIYSGLQKVNNLPRLASAEQYGNGLWEAFKNDGIAPNNDIYGNGSSPVIPAFLDAAQTIPSANTDWVGALFDSALTSSYNLSISKGGEKSNTFLSIGYFNQEGVLKHTNFDKYNLRVNSDYNITKNLKIGENLLVAFSNNTSVATNSLLGSPIYSAYRIPSIAPIYDINGDFTGYPINDIENPLGRLDRNKDNNDKNVRIFGNVYGEIKLLEDFTFKSNVGVTFNQLNGTTFNPTFTEPNVFRVAANLTKVSQELSEIVFSNTLNYSKEIGEKHNINVLLGVEAIESKLEISSAFREGFPGNDSNFQVLNAGGAGTQQNTGNKVESTLMSYFGKVNYGFDDKYLVSLTARRDGTSKLLNNKWGTFYAASLGWKISNEEFFKNIESVSNLKLRFGVGQNGNQDIPPYVTAGGFFSNPFNSNYSIDGSQNSAFSGYILSRNSNPDLEWETTEQYNFGLDLGFINNRITLSLDYFNKKTKDLLLERNLTPSSGGTNSTIWDNVGAMENKGLEISANYNSNNQKDFKYNIGLNASIIRNELTSLKDGVDFVGIDAVALRNNNFDQEVSRTAVGQSIASFYGWEANGIFQSQSEIDSHAKQSDGTSPGDIRFNDINNDDVIDDKDRTFIGNPHPDLNMNLTLDFEYKNFDLNLFFRSSFGNEVYDLTRYYSDFYNLSNYNKSSRITNAWSPSNTASEIPRLSLNDPNNNIRPSSYYVKDASFVRLQSLQMGYNMPENIIENLSLSRLRLYLNVQNVFVLTNYDGVDPEIGLQNNSSDSRNLDIGVDRAIYPPSRTFTLGLNVSF